jgi:hypothetical protein
VTIMRPIKGAKSRQIHLKRRLWAIRASREISTIWTKIFRQNGSRIPLLRLRRINLIGSVAVIGLGRCP